MNQPKVINPIASKVTSNFMGSSEPMLLESNHFWWQVAIMSNAESSLGMSFSDGKNEYTGFFMLAHQFVSAFGTIVRKIDCRGWIRRQNS